MDKFLMSIGAAIVALGVGFLIAYEIIPQLHGAFVTGGYLWTVLGAGVIGLGYKVNRPKKTVYKGVV